MPVKDKKRYNAVHGSVAFWVRRPPLAKLFSIIEKEKNASFSRRFPSRHRRNPVFQRVRFFAREIDGFVFRGTRADRADFRAAYGGEFGRTLRISFKTQSALLLLLRRTIITRVWPRRAKIYHPKLAESVISLSRRRENAVSMTCRTIRDVITPRTTGYVPPLVQPLQAPVDRY